MPEVLWRTMMRQHPKAHLVVGVVTDRGNPKDCLAHLARLTRALRLTGMYAMAEVPERDGNHIHCVLEKRTDADRLGTAVDASPVDRYAGWASQRRFYFDRAATNAVDAMFQRRSRGRGMTKRGLDSVLS